LARRKIACAGANDTARRINFRASGNRVTARIRSCDGREGLNARGNPWQEVLALAKQKNEKGKIYEKASFHCSGDKRIGGCSGTAF
jgi:hypothetical protein